MFWRKKMWYCIVKCDEARYDAAEVYVPAKTFEAAVEAALEAVYPGEGKNRSASLVTKCQRYHGKHRGVFG